MGKGRNGVLSDPLIISLILLLFLEWDQKLAQSQTNNEPVNVNWVIATPWDVSNTLRAPLGGPVSLILSAFMACILFFGLLLAPVNYIFGYPSRIYHQTRTPGIFGRSLTSHGSAQGNYPYYHHNNTDEEQHRLSPDMADILVHLWDQVSERVTFDRDEDFQFEGNSTGREIVVKSENWDGMGFLESIFLLVPEENEECRQLMVCHAHGFLGFLPNPGVKLYQWLSKHFIAIPDNYKSAITLGLEDQGSCQDVYTNCDKNLFQLARGSVGLIRQTLVNYFPSGTVDLWRYFYSSYQARSHDEL